MREVFELTAKVSIVILEPIAEVLTGSSLTKNPLP
jgi:hypothetical protein